MKAKLQNFLAGRYGQDKLNRFLTYTAIALYVVSLLTGFMPLYFLSAAMLLFTIYRSLSRNMARRAKENYAYFTVRSRILAFFKTKADHFAQRKTHRFYKCPSCRQVLRVPKGRGQIRIDCPKCHTEFTKNT